MKLKKGFLLAEVAGEFIAVPADGQDSQFHGIVRLNATAADIWRGLEAELSPEEIAARLAEDYEGVTREEAEKQVRAVMEQLRAKGILEA